MLHLLEHGIYRISLVMVINSVTIVVLLWKHKKD